jgi:hypothetical protein
MSCLMTSDSSPDSGTRCCIPYVERLLETGPASSLGRLDSLRGAVEESAAGLGLTSFDYASISHRTARKPASH